MSSQKPLRVALLQRPASPDRDANLRATRDALARAASAGARLAVLEELFAGPYFCDREAAERFELAEGLDDSLVRGLADWARELGLVLVGSFFERRAAGLYHNSATVHSERGELLGLYRKMHIPDDPGFTEKFYFTPGDGGGSGTSRSSRARDGFLAVPTTVGCLGPLICWDQWYPEAARLTTLLGAELLLYPTAIGWLAEEKAALGQDQLEAWRTMHRAHAIANGVFVLAVNRVGQEERVEFWGHSLVVDPFGRVLAEAGEGEELLLCDLDLSLIESTRRDWPFLRDRRVDAYRGLTERYLDQTKHDAP